MPMPPPLVSPPRAARILNRREAAGYLGISQKSVILLEAQGALVRVALIAGPSKGRRRALYDIADLDRLVEQRKQRHRQAAPMSRPRRRRPEHPHVDAGPIAFLVSDGIQAVLAHVSPGERDVLSRALDRFVLDHQTRRRGSAPWPPRSPRSRRSGRSWTAGMARPRPTPSRRSPAEREPLDTAS
jgi:hypothetical protein